MLRQRRLSVDVRCCVAGAVSPLLIAVCVLLGLIVVTMLFNAAVARRHCRRTPVAEFNNPLAGDCVGV